MGWTKDEAVFARDSLNRKESILYREKLLKQAQEEVSLVILTNPSYLASLIERVRNAEQAEIPHEKQWVVGQFVTTFDSDRFWDHEVEWGTIKRSGCPDKDEYVVFQREIFLGGRLAVWSKHDTHFRVYFGLMKEVQDVD